MRSERTLNIPVIYLTAYTDESTIQKAKETEPHGYIIKPFKEVDIHTTIEMAIYKHSEGDGVAEGARHAVRYCGEHQGEAGPYVRKV